MQNESNNKPKNKFLSCILCMALIVAMVLSVTGCNGGKADETPSAAQPETSVQPETAVQPMSQVVQTQDSVLGTGETKFTFTVTDRDGNETRFEIHTDKATVGEALVELDLIAGDESEYGLYVKTVNGITADYDEDGVYWAFYVDGEYATSGVDTTAVTEGADYAFKVE
ncbi:MAG: DUF4430 domain-containing protein [Roseburia sp.]|nr:DUF4430 domain-containing protein [Roseburia sp.]